MCAKINNVTGDVIRSTKLSQVNADVGWVMNNQIVIMNDDTLVTSVRIMLKGDLNSCLV